MIYTLEQIRAIVAPIARKHGIPAIYLFGSYARGTAREESDVDLLIDTAGTQLRSLLSLGALYCELEEALQKSVDLITVRSLRQPVRMPSEEAFQNAVMKERVTLYDAA